MSSFQIVGSVQLRNEDIYVEQVVLNILDFCDTVIITDHQSTDRTFEICKRLADEHPKIELSSIQSLREAAIAIESFFGTNTWMFGVDGDEIYDPHGLHIMRKQLLGGAFAKDFSVFGNVLNVTSMNLKKKTARGHLAPPSRSMTKLYNFSMIESWINCPERLLGDDLTFKNGFNANLRRYLHEELYWEQSYFRCLHMPFMRRSSVQRIRLSRTRLNPDELNRIANETNGLARLGDWKNQKYRRGPRVEKDVSVFFPDA